MVAEIPRFPIRRPLTIIQGDDFSRYLGLKYYDPADETLKLLNTSGYTARMTVRASYDTPALVTATNANGRITVGIQGTAPYQWNLTIAIPNAVTSALTDWGMGVYDLELVDTYGKVMTILYGSCCLQREASY